MGRMFDYDSFRIVNVPTLRVGGLKLCSKNFKWTLFRNGLAFEFLNGVDGISDWIYLMILDYRVQVYWRAVNICGNWNVLCIVSLCWVWWVASSMGVMNSVFKMFRCAVFGFGVWSEFHAGSSSLNLAKPDGITRNVKGACRSPHRERSLKQVRSAFRDSNAIEIFSPSTAQEFGQVMDVSE